MFRLDRAIKPRRDAAALNAHINLYGFWNETTFLTKSGDLGMVLRVPGVDYESLDSREQEYAVKRLEAALKAFGLGFHIYQYLFKSNRPEIPFASYDDPVVEAAIDQRRQFFEGKRDHLYQVEIFYCVLLEGARSKTGVGAALARRSCSTEHFDGASYPGRYSGSRTGLGCQPDLLCLARLLSFWRPREAVCGYAGSNSHARMS